MRLPLTYLAFLLVWLPFSAKAQYGSVEGYVCDDWDESMLGVVVIVYNERKPAKKYTLGTSTDPYGYYKIDSIPAGTYKLRTSFMGYNDYLITGINIDSSIRIADIHCKPNYNLSFGECPSPVYIPFTNIKNTKIVTIEPNSTTSDSTYIITGIVQNEEGKPIRKAVVTVFVTDSFVTRTLSDKNGHYRLRINCSKPFKLNYYAKYKGKKRRKYFYPVIIIEEIPPSVVDHTIDVKIYRSKYIRCGEVITVY